MVEITFLCVALVGMLCSVQGQTFTISTKFMNGALIFTWSNISARINDVEITRDSTSKWERVSDDQFTVENVLQYKVVKIRVREYISNTHVDYNKTYNINTVQSKEGEARNISWTADYFPQSGLYFIFHVYKGSASTILRISNAGPASPSKKYVYHTRPFNSTKILFEVRNITVKDAGYYVGSPTEANAWSEGRGIVLVVSGKPEKPIITGDQDVKVRYNAFLKCESKSTSAPDYYKNFPPLSYLWFVNNTKLDREDRETYSFTVTKDVKYNRYSCQAKETLESERSEEIRINPLYGPERVVIIPQPPDEGLNVHDRETFGPYTCSADCNPPCTLQWKFKTLSDDFKNATSIGDSSITLPEQTANRSSMASIRCVANGKEGRKPLIIKLNIQYLLVPKVYLNGSLQNALTVKERNPLLLSCFVDGNPTPEVTLRKLTSNGILQQTVSSWLNYTPNREAQCSDTDIYICEGHSSEFGSKNQSFSIEVLCEPRLDESVSPRNNYGSRIGPDIKVFVSLPVIANPLTSSKGLAWLGPTLQPIETKISQRDNVIYKHWINSTIPIPDQGSFGNYSLIYKGKTIADITINAEDKPQPPLNFTGYSYATGYINLTWLSNFNGGPEQFFILSVKEGFNWAIVKNLTDPGEGNIGYIDQGPLISGKQYWYRLDSCNRIDCSSRPAEVKVTVRALSSSLSKSNDTAIVIGASVAIFVFVVVLAIIVAVYLVKKKAQQREKNEKRLSESIKDDNNQPDVVVYAAVDKSLLMKNKQQADVVKSDVIKDQNDERENVYSNTEEAKLLSNSDGKRENKKKKKREKTHQEAQDETGATYGNVESRTVNQDGLIYIDVDFANKPPSPDTKGKPVIHGEEERTEYMFVDFSKKAPPIQETEDGE